MTEEQASIYISILHKHYNNIELTFANTRGTYRKLLVRFDYEKFATTLDDLLLENKFCPKPPEIIEMYNRRFGEKDKNLQFANYENVKCTICNDLGAIAMRLDDGYEWTLHCKCQIGKKAQYDGRNRSTNPSPYVTEPIAKYIDPESLRQPHSPINRGPGYELFLAECKRLGLSARLIMSPPERKIPCPF